MANISDSWSINLRPHSFKEYYGQDNIKKYMYACAKDRSFPTATLFMGQYGGGKTTAAQIEAAMISCEHPTADGDPCGECPACKAIFEERFNRECIMIDGGQAGKADVVDTISTFVATPPFKDRAKVVILEEVQELSKSALDSLLKLTETRRPNIHFIFTAMEAMKGSGITSRCTPFTFKYAQVPEIMYFLKDVMEKTKLWTNPEIPQQFKLEGLQLIAENSEGSYRTAIQKLQQCWKSRTFDIKEMQEVCGLINVSDFYTMMKMVLNGEQSEELFNTLLGTPDYTGSFNLSMKVISDAECYRLFKNVPGNSAFFKKQAAELSSHKNFPILRDGMMKLQEENNSYMKKSVYLIGLCNIIDKCRNANSQPAGMTTPPVQSPAQPQMRRIIV